MKMSVILGSILACSLFIATSALAQTTHSAAGTCRGKTAAVDACFNGNNEGWLWFSWANSGACNAQSAPLVCGLEELSCDDMLKRKRIIVDGNCGSPINCFVRVVRAADGSTLGGYPLQLNNGSTGPGNIHEYNDVPCGDIWSRNYATVQCDVPVGCKIWGLSTVEL